MVTFFNPSNSGYINYGVTGTSVIDGILRIDGVTKPPFTAPFLGWFEINQVNNVTTFKSLYPGQVGGQDQYIIPGKTNSVTSRPDILPVTIGVPVAPTDNLWIVGGPIK
jgi:hypothetical protein